MTYKNLQDMNDAIIEFAKTVGTDYSNLNKSISILKQKIELTDLNLVSEQLTAIINNFKSVSDTTLQSKLIELQNSINAAAAAGAGAKGWTSELVLDSAQNKTQSQINADIASKIDIANELYVSSYIKKLDGVTDNSADFQALISTKAGKKLILKAGETITLTTPVNTDSNLFLSGEGKISINHTGVGITSSANIIIDGNIVIDGNDKAQSALSTTNGNSVCKIGGGVNIINLYSANQYVVAVKTVSKINIFDDIGFKRLRCIGNGVEGDTTGIVRCILMGGDSVTFINRLNATDVNNVDINGNNVIEDADAIQTQNGVQYLSISNSEFTNVGKRWLKIQGNHGSKTVINNLKGSSAWTNTVDGAAEKNNGMFSPVSIYAGSATIDGIEFNGGASQSLLNITGDTVTKVTIDNVNYNPIYQNYVQTGVTRFISGATAPNLDLTVGDNVTSTNTHEGIYINESVPFLRCKLGACEIKSKSTVVAGGYKSLEINGFRVTHTTPIATTTVSIPAVTEMVRINGLYIAGAYAYGIYVAGSRTTNLSGVITGVQAPQVTDTVRLTGGMTQYLKGLQIFGNSGNGTIESAQSATKHTLRSKDGATDYVVADSAGLAFNFRVFTTANLQSATHLVNTTSKVAGSAVYDSTAKKLMIASGATATAAWVSSDGATTVTPV